MKHKTTMQDIANQLNITKVTVSKALNNKPGVSESLRNRIVETASDMGYVIHKSSNTKKTFAFIVPKRFFLETEKFYNVIFYYLNRLCIEKGYQLTPIVLSQKDEEAGITLPASVNGVYLAGELSDPCIQSFCRAEPPIVAIDFYKTYPDLNCVLVENFYLGYYATHYLIEKGHRHIGFVGNINQTSSINDRYFGYLKALQNLGIKQKDEWIIANNDPKTGLYEIDIPFPNPLPTAFVCHCDMAAYFLMNSLKKLGKSVPQDVSLISFDNTDLSQSISPKLTSMDIDKKEIAETSFRVMEKIIRGEQGRHRYYISSCLAERDSVNEFTGCY